VVEDQSKKLANTVDTNQRLRLVYCPVSVASVRRFDEARAIGAKLLEQNGQKALPFPLWEYFREVGHLLSH
jgi:hypothetical protein